MSFDLNLATRPPYFFRLFVIAKCRLSIPGGIGETLMSQYDMEGKTYNLRIANGQEKQNNVLVSSSRQGYDDQFLFLLLGVAKPSALNIQALSVVQTADTFLRQIGSNANAYAVAKSGTIACTPESVAKDTNILRSHFPYIIDMLRTFKLS